MANEIISIPTSAVKNIAGLKRDRLMVKKFVGYNPKGHDLWLCECICGNTRISTRYDFNRGGFKSCGCYQREVSRDRVTTHGKTKTKEFRIWTGMKTRTTNPKCPQYHRYGGRGISICERWMNSFDAFLSDMGTCPSDKHSIDRINNDGNYEPSNCRWSTFIEQCSNRRNNRKITHNGLTLTVSEWARRVGLHRTGLKNRLDKGWSVEAALTTPPTDRRDRRNMEIPYSPSE